MKIYIDGQLVPRAEARISVFDHGLLYGDGVFEGIRFYGGGVFKLPEHIDRLYASARAINLSIRLTKEQMVEAVLETIRANGLRDGYVRLVVTRGEGGLGLNPYLCEKSSVIVIADGIQLYAAEKYEHGLAMVTCATRRQSAAALSPAIKSLNYLNNILAKMEAIHARADEGLMLNEQGFVAECTGDNIFVVRSGEIATPPVSAGALNGVTRLTLIDLARRAGYTVREENLTRVDIWTADECLLTGTAAEVIPAVELDGRSIGTGQPGPISRELIAAFRKEIPSCATAVYR